MITQEESNHRRGLWAAASAFFLWGILPIYWMALRGLPAVEIVAHRVTWSVVSLVPLLMWRGSWGDFTSSLRSPRQLGIHSLTALLLSGNWLIYIWATLHGRIIECSLGYFLTPLANVALGYLFLHERLSPPRKIAVSCAAIGVAIQFTQITHLPWVALTLAASFSVYGLIKKQSALGPLASLTLETSLLAPMAIAYLAFLNLHGSAATRTFGPSGWALLALSGIITSTPLILFAAGAKKLPLHTLGLLQYLAPTLQFLLAWLLYREKLDGTRLLSFLFIWFGLLIYALDLWKTRTMPSS